MIELAPPTARGSASSGILATAIALVAGFRRAVAGRVLRFLERQLRGVQRPSLGAEWAWVVGRIGVIAVCYPAAYVFMRGTGADLFVYGGATFAAVYNLGIVALLKRRLATRAFLAGLVLDNATLLVGWWGVTWSLAGSKQTHDLYLVIFPILVIGVVRLGGFFGAVYTAGWLAWMTWANIHYYGPGAYDVEQLPVRIPLIAVTSLLTLNLVSRLNAERRRAEELQGETAALAELGRVAGSTLNLGEVYDRLSVLSARLLPFDQLAICAVDQSDGTLTVEYVSGTAFVAGEQAARRAQPISGASLRRAIRLRRPVVVDEQESIEVQRRQSGNDGGQDQEVRAILIAPVVAGEQVIAALIARSAVPRVFKERHLQLADGIATTIAGALANARVYRQAVQLAEERELRVKLDASNQELKRLSEEKNNLLSAVTHELKTPLASIIAFNDLMLKNRQAALTERDMQHLTVMRRNAERLNELIADLMDISRVEAGSLRLENVEIDVNQLVREIETSFEPILSGKRQRLSIDTATDGATVTADRTRIAQVISNLLSNASKYSPPSSEILLRTWIEGDRLRVSVRDQGIGISRDDQEKIFTAFFRAANAETRAQQGTGLGLMISRGIVEAHGGTIEVESELGIGTTVRFSLPGASRPGATRP